MSGWEAEGKWRAKNFGLTLAILLIVLKSISHSLLITTKTTVCWLFFRNIEKWQKRLFAHVVIYNLLE